MRRPTTLIFLTAFLASCKREAELLEPLPGAVPVDVAAVIECQRAAGLDSASISQRLLGQWRWWATECYWTGVGQVTADVRLNFGRQGDLTVSNDGTITHHKWHLDGNGYGQWFLSAEPYSADAAGQVIVCQDSLVFYNSSHDACDNLFIRMK